MAAFIDWVIEKSINISNGQHVCVLQRIVRMGGPVDDDMANLIVAQLLYLDSTSNNKDIIMYVNSPGGSVTAGQQQNTILQRPLSKLQPKFGACVFACLSLIFSMHSMPYGMHCYCAHFPELEQAHMPCGLHCYCAQSLMDSMRR